MQRAKGSGPRGRKEIARQRAGSGECVAVVALALWCAAGIVAAAPARGAEEVDLCPHTPAGAESLVAGCAAVDIAATPDVFYAPALRRLEALREGRRLPACPSWWAFLDTNLPWGATRV